MERWLEIENDAALLPDDAQTAAMREELCRFPTELLEQELRRRDGVRDTAARQSRIRYCDDCIHFSKGACLLRHPIKLRVPRSMWDAVSGEWGFHRKGCRDRVLEGEFYYIEGRQRFDPTTDQLSEWETQDLLNNPLAGEQLAGACGRSG